VGGQQAQGNRQHGIAQHGYLLEGKTIRYRVL
jgi:hypothetical protein